MEIKVDTPITVPKAGTHPEVPRDESEMFVDMGPGTPRFLDAKDIHSAQMFGKDFYFPFHLLKIPT